LPLRGNDVSVNGQVHLFASRRMKMSGCENYEGAARRKPSGAFFLSVDQDPVRKN
jgi:hypothetical protein